MKRYLQKQQPEAFHKKSVLKKFHKTHMKTSVSESLLQKTPTQMFFSVNFAKKFKSTYFIEHLRKAACVSNKITP